MERIISTVEIFLVFFVTIYLLFCVRQGSRDWVRERENRNEYGNRQENLNQSELPPLAHEIAN